MRSWSSVSRKIGCRLLPRWITWCGWSASVRRGSRAIAGASGGCCDRLRRMRGFGQRKTCGLQRVESELRQQLPQALRRAGLSMAGAARNDEFVLHAVLPADQFGHRDLVAMRLEQQATQHV